MINKEEFDFSLNSTFSYKHNFSTSICSLFLKGKSCLVYCVDNNIIIHEFFSNKKDILLKGHTETVLYIIQLENNNLVSASEDSTIKFWSINDYNCILTLKGHEDWVIFLLEINNNLLASCSIDGYLKIWDINKQSCLYNFTHDEEWINCIVKVKEGIICSCGDDYKIKFWDYEKGIFLYEIKNDIGINIIEKINDNLIISYDKKFKIKVWNINNKENCYEIQTKYNNVTNLFNINDNRIAIIFENHDILIFDYDNKLIIKI
jgi:WD40 repeat protein